MYGLPVTGQSQWRDRHCILHYASTYKQLQCWDLEGPSSQETALVSFLLNQDKVSEYIVSSTAKVMLSNTPSSPSDILTSTWESVLSIVILFLISLFFSSTGTQLKRSKSASERNYMSHFWCKLTSFSLLHKSCKIWNDLYHSLIHKGGLCRTWHLPCWSADTCLCSDGQRFCCRLLKPAFYLSTESTSPEDFFMSVAPS